MQSHSQLRIQELSVALESLGGAKALVEADLTRTIESKQQVESNLAAAMVQISEVDKKLTAVTERLEGELASSCNLRTALKEAEETCAHLREESAASASSYAALIAAKHENIKSLELEKETTAESLLKQANELDSIRGQLEGEQELRKVFVLVLRS